MMPIGPLMVEHRLIERMLAEFHEFDRALIHEHYRRVVERLEVWEPGARPGAEDREAGL